MPSRAQCCRAQSGSTISPPALHASLHVPSDRQALWPSNGSIIAWRKPSISGLSVRELTDPSRHRPAVITVEATPASYSTPFDTKNAGPPESPLQIFEDGDTE